MVFDPGTTAKTPEQVGAGGGSGGSGGSGGGGGGGEMPTTTQQEASMFDALPWWAWAAIAVGGVTILGVVGVMALGKDEEEEEEGRVPYSGPRDAVDTYRY